jgi:hypothetical protein
MPARQTDAVPGEPCPDMPRDGVHRALDQTRDTYALIELTGAAAFSAAPVATSWQAGR